MLWTYDLARGVARPSKPMETGAQNNFYSVHDETGAYRDDLDLWLQGVEDKAAAPYERLLRGEIPRGQERADFSTFVASLYARSPATVRNAAEMHGQFVQMLTNLHWGTRESFERNLDKYESEKGPITVSRDELWEFYNDRSQYRIRVDQSAGLPILGASDKIQEILFGRNWCLLEAAEDFFITCDSPVFRGLPSDAPPPHPVMGDGGFLNPLAEVTLPLSPSKMLLLTGRPVPRSPGLVPRADVWRLNRHRAYAAHSFIYAHVRDPRVERLANDFREQRPRMKLSGPGDYAPVDVMTRMKSNDT